VQNRKRPDTRFFIGRGKVEQLKRIVSKYTAQKDKITVIVDGSLKPIQYFNLVKTLGNVEIIDRVQLILEIFDKHAGSKEAKLQIELARLKHIVPIIKEWVRQRKLGELPGFLGAGKYKVESYYLLIKRRITHIERELKRIRSQREKLRKHRQELGLRTIAIVGYTSAGKTTLFNVLTGEAKKIGKELFTTLSPKVKSAFINGAKVLFLDTVGFIDYVPLEIIEAFFSTLEEIVDAEVLILVVDISEEHSEILRKMRGVIETFAKIGVSGKPMVIVANKIDLVRDFSEVVEKSRKVYNVLSTSYDGPLAITYVSALNRIGIDDLKSTLAMFIKAKTFSITATIPEDSLYKIKAPFILAKKKNGLCYCIFEVKDYELSSVINELKKCTAKILEVKRAQ